MRLSRPKAKVNYGLALSHNTFTQEALALIRRSGEGFLRRARNLCLGALFVLGWPIRFPGVQSLRAGEGINRHLFPCLAQQ